MKKFLLILALALPVAIQPGCTTPVAERQEAYATLKVVGLSAKTFIDGAAEMLKNGKINVAQWNDISHYYDNVFQPAFQVAVNAAGSDLSVSSPQLMAIFGQLAAIASQLSVPPSP